MLYSSFQRLMFSFFFLFVFRILSAWFYRGHNPNNDFFHVRPYFKDIWEGRRPKVIFEEYIEMPEYQNIQTRMLGADSFPYRNVTVDKEVRTIISIREVLLYPCTPYDYIIIIALMDLTAGDKTFMCSLQFVQFALNLHFCMPTSQFYFLFFPSTHFVSTLQVYNLAIEAMNNIFFIGIQEEYNLSVEVMLRELRVTLKTKITKERNQQQDSYIKAQHLALKNNKKLIARVRSLNSHDAALYDSAYLRFCTTIKKYPDLYKKMKERSRNQCDILYNSSLN